MPEQEDWIKSVSFLGWDGSQWRPILVGSGGQLYIIAKGEDGGGVLRNIRVDTSGQIIMVPRGQSGNYLTVDSDGYLTTVIKGDYEGTLRTVKLDDEGRLSAFIIDSSDAWGRMLQVGNAELAARLGSPVRYEQRGRVQFVESFESGMQRWGFFYGGAGSKAELDPTLCVTGGYSVRLTGGSDGDLMALIEHKENCFTAVRVGAEMAFSFRDAVDKCSIAIVTKNGTTKSYGALRLDQMNGELYVRTGETTWTKVTDVKARTEDPVIFDRMKIVFDISTTKYVRGFLDNQEFDLSAYSIWTVADAAAPLTTVAIRMYSTAGQNRTMNVDDIILTTAEPA